MYRHIFRQPYVSVGLIVIDLIVLSQTNPSSDIALVLFVISIVVLTIWSVTMYIVRLYVSRLQLNANLRARQRLIAVAIAGSLSYVVLMQSIGQLNFADILALIPFCGLFFLYQTYGQQGSQKSFEPTKRS